MIRRAGSPPVLGSWGIVRAMRSSKTPIVKAPLPHREQPVTPMPRHVEHAAARRLQDVEEPAGAPRPRHQQTRGIGAAVDVVVLPGVGLAARHLRDALLTEVVVVVVDDRDALIEDPAFAQRVAGAHVDEHGIRRLCRGRQLDVHAEVDRLALGLDVNGDLRAGDGAGHHVRRRLRAEDVLLGLLADLLPPAPPVGLRRHARPVQLHERVGQLGDLRQSGRVRQRADDAVGAFILDRGRSGARATAAASGAGDPRAGAGAERATRGPLPPPPPLPALLPDAPVLPDAPPDPPVPEMPPLAAPPVPGSTVARNPCRAGRARAARAARSGRTGRSSATGDAAAGARASRARRTSGLAARAGLPTSAAVSARRHQQRDDAGREREHDARDRQQCRRFRSHGSPLFPALRWVIAGALVDLFRNARDINKRQTDAGAITLASG